jgi:peroxiredoxin
MAITLITENYELDPPSTEQLQEWADEYGQTFPVLSDADPVALRYTTRPTLSLPSISLLAPGGLVLIADGDVSEDDILAALP